MLRIRLQRTGRENLPTFRIVVAEHFKPVKGKFKEIIGYYLPRNEPPTFEVRQDRITHWIRHGAAPSNTLARLLKRHGYKEQGIDLEKFIEPYTKKKKKGEQSTSAKPPEPSPTQKKTEPIPEQATADKAVKESSEANKPS